MRCLLIIWCYRTPSMITFETSAINENLSPTFHRTNKRMRPHLRMSGTSYRLDETYVKVGTEWKYLYRAIDSAGSTIEFMPSARRDVSAAKRFFKKLMRADHRRLPFTIGTDKLSDPVLRSRRMKLGRRVRRGMVRSLHLLRLHVGGIHVGLPAAANFNLLPDLDREQIFRRLERPRVCLPRLCDHPLRVRGVGVDGQPRPDAGEHFARLLGRGVLREDGRRRRR